ncbi:MAG: alpha-amylase, partial [Pseudomonadota bacterium]
RDYIQLGRMDFLYDKVGLYDTLKLVIQEKEETDAIAKIHAEVSDIKSHMLHFLENHDEQRIASNGFAGDATKAKPAMVVSALLSQSPTMLYFAQDVGEPGDGDAGFGDPTRTTIFDYWGVPSHQRWMNGGKFNGGRLTDAEKSLRDFYVRLMTFSASSSALNGAYREIHSANRQHTAGYDGRLFSFVRWDAEERLVVLSNFNPTQDYDLTMLIPEEIIELWGLDDGKYPLTDALDGKGPTHLLVKDGMGRFETSLLALESAVFRLAATH